MKKRIISMLLTVTLVSQLVVNDQIVMAKATNSIDDSVVVLDGTESTSEKESSSKDSSEEPAKENQKEDKTETPSVEATTKEATDKEATTKEASDKEATTKEVPSKVAPSKEATTEEESTEEDTTEEETTEEETEENDIPSDCVLREKDAKNIDQTDSDKDGLIDYWEEMIGTDPECKDTDGDGLTDYEEFALIGTDPLLYSTLDNGVSDYDADQDGDGLTNGEEIKLGTDPCNADSDFDTISDYDEVKYFGLNPLSADSNKDGILDNEEVNAGIELCSDEEDRQALMDEMGISEKTIIDLCPAGKKDSNKDGISDEYTKLMCDGKILTWDGNKVFGDKPYEHIQRRSDIDLDKLKNGAELELHEVDGVKMVVLKSDPTKKDTDGDGINDKDDTAPLTAGLAGGVIGQLRIIGRHSEDAIFIEGHSYLVFTSYIDNVKLSVDDLYNYFTYNGDLANIKNVSELSWRSEFNEVSEDNLDARKASADAQWTIASKNGRITNKNDNTITLNRGEFASIGNYTMTSYAQSMKDAITGSKEVGILTSMEAIKVLYDKYTGKDINMVYILAHVNSIIAQLIKAGYIDNKHVLTGVTDGGIWFNREMYNQKFQWEQFPNAIYEIDITQEQYDRMVSFLSLNNFYNPLKGNCSTVSSGAWNAAVGYDYDADTNYKGEFKKTKYYINSQGSGIFKIFDLPASVKDSIKALSEDDSTNAKKYIDKQRIVMGTFVKNTELAEDEDEFDYVENEETSNEESSDTETPDNEASNNEDSNNGTSNNGTAQGNKVDSANNTEADNNNASNSEASNNNSSDNNAGTNNSNTSTSSGNNSSDSIANGSEAGSAVIHTVGTVKKVTETVNTVVDTVKKFFKKFFK